MNTTHPETPVTPRAKPRDWRDFRRQTDAMSLGIEMVMAIALGAYLGYLFDGEFQSGPWGMIFFVLAGTGAAAKAVIRVWRQTKGHLSRATRGVSESYAHPTHGGGTRWSSGRLDSEKDRSVGAER